MTDTAAGSRHSRGVSRRALRHEDAGLALVLAAIAIPAAIDAPRTIELALPRRLRHVGGAVSTLPATAGEAP